ncbi:TRAP transporter small permease [Litorivicinus lipolyticus]|uniref:TRAP transporter small permease n=1 Tax=Litorivicinus lipolyticus TaxID=418701 RepID=UPI003B5C1351
MAYWPHLCLLALVAALFVWERFKPQAVANLEENMLVGLMALLTLVSFGQVVARYGFNTGWSAALEFTTLAFSWLILVGMSYGIRTGTHLGVDILLKAMPPKSMRYMAAFGAFSGVLYGLILLDASWMAYVGIETRSGAIDYWAKMYKINIGTEELRWPLWVQDTFGVKDRVQRWLVLIMLPVGLALLAFRSLQAMVQILMGQRDMVIASHEAEDLVEENKGVLKELD